MYMDFLVSVKSIKSEYRLKRRKNSDNKTTYNDIGLEKLDSIVKKELKKNKTQKGGEYEESHSSLFFYCPSD